MPSTNDRLAVTTDVDPAIVQAVVRQGLVVGVLVLVGGLVRVLPGAGREIPGTGLSVGALMTTGVAAAVLATIVLSTAAVGTLVRACVVGPREVVDDLAGAARFGLVLLAVLVAYAGFAPSVVPQLAGDSVWAYDVAFLGFALFPVVGVARRLHRSADPVARELSRWLVGPEPGTGGAETGADGSG